MIDLFKVFMSPKAAEEVATVINSGYIGEGPKVKLFESELKKVFNNDYVVTTNSATSAEHLILHLLKSPDLFRDLQDAQYGITSEIKWEGFTKDDVVLTTPLTCTATNWPILANNMKLQWVDIDPNTMNMDLDDLARKITKHTKIIFIVHWGGYPVDLDKIRKIQAKAYQTYGFRPLVIQDCAHAIGSTYKGKHLADTGDICTFSFQAIKHMTCGDGGALVVPYKELYDRAKLTRWYGIDRESNRKDFRCETDIKEFGFKFHMNDISATIGLSNLPFLRTVLDTHRTNANLYNEKLKNIPGLTLLENKPDRESSYWIYTIKVQNREGFMKKMSEAGIQVSRVHERNDKHTCVNEFKSILPNLDQVVNEMICIPVGWWVTKENAEFIIDTIKKGW